MNLFFAFACNSRAILPGSWRYIRSDVPVRVTAGEREELRAAPELLDL